MCGKAPFLRRVTSPAVSFVSFLLKRSKRKSIAEALFSYAPVVCANVLRKTDGSYANRPFFRSESCAEKRLFSVGSPLPPCLLSRFFLKEAKENPLPERCFPMLPSVAPTCSAKRTVHTRTVCFFVSNRMCGMAPFLRRTTSPAVPFVSFLLRRKEAKENPLPKRCFPMLPPLAPTCCAKRTVHTRTVRFFVSFVSFLQERKLFPAIVYPIR